MKQSKLFTNNNTIIYDHPSVSQAALMNSFQDSTIIFYITTKIRSITNWCSFFMGHVLLLCCWFLAPLPALTYSNLNFVPHVHPDLLWCWFLAPSVCFDLLWCWFLAPSLPRHESQRPSHPGGTLLQTHCTWRNSTAEDMRRQLHPDLSSSSGSPENINPRYTVLLFNMHKYVLVL